MTLAVCGGRHTDADSRSHVTRLHSEPEASTGVGQRRDLFREDGAGCVPGELGGVTPHQAGLEHFGGWNFFGRFGVLSLHLVKHTAFPQSDVPPSPPPDRGVVALQERYTITFTLPGG